MRNSILVRFLRQFSTREMRGLASFVQNPYFNSNKDVIRLFGYLERFAPRFDDKSLNAENAFKFIYPDKTFNKARLNELMNRLLFVVGKFIGAIKNTANRIDVEISILIFCKERYPERFKSQLRKVRRLLDGKEKGSTLHHYIATLEYELCEYQAVNGEYVDYNAFAEALDKFYWLSKLPLFAEMLNYKLIKADNRYDLSRLKIYLKFVEQTGYTQMPLIELWYCIVNIFKNIIDKVPVAIEDYQRFKALFFQNLDDLHPNDKRNLYIYLRNIIRFTSFDDADYYKEEFEIDQLGLEKSLIFFNGFLRELSIKNIVNSAIRLGGIQWTKDFLEQYKDVFWKKFADDVLAYCKAVINFYEGKYDEALVLFGTVEYDNVFFEIERRIKLIQIYYETDELDLFDNQIRSLRTYISRSRDRVGEPYIQSYREFNNYAEKLPGIIKRDLDKIRKWETKIQETPARLLFEKKWLLDKLEELKK